MLERERNRERGSVESRIVKSKIEISRKNFGMHK
jgi:hypothetical protein